MSKSLSKLWDKKIYIHDFTDWEIDWILEEKENSEKLIDFFSFENQIFEIEPIKVTANIATYPLRFESLLKMLDSIEGQFDEIRIYLNEYQSVPPELEKYTTFIRKNITDNGKFFWSLTDAEYYFTLDDDFIYPPDYVKKTLPQIGDRIVSYHGRQLRGVGKSYYRGHKIYAFDKTLTTEKVIDVASTGLMAYNTKYFNPQLWKKPIYKMSDLVIALDATLSQKKIVCLPHTSNWIGSIINEDLPSIYLDFLSSDKEQTKISDMIQMYRDNTYKFDDKYKAVTFTKESILTLEKEFAEFENVDTFYNLGFGDVKLLMYLHLTDFGFKNLVGVETSNERIELGFLTITEFDITINQIKLVSQQFEKLKFKKNSIILMNDSTMKQDQVQEIFNNLNDNNIFITSKILSTPPQKKLQLNLLNEEVVTYYIYKVIKSHPDYEAPYQKSYLINAIDHEEGKKRWKNILTLSNNYYNLERFRATMGKTDNWSDFVTETWNRGWFRRDKKEIINLSDSEVGCGMSHLRVWKKMIQDEIEVAMVLEDDACNVFPNLTSYLIDYTNQLPKDWDIFLIGFSMYEGGCKRITDDIYKVNRFILTHSYLINKTAVKKLLDLLPINMPFDSYLSQLSDSGKINIYRHNFTTRINGKHGALVRQYCTKGLITHTNIVFDQTDSTFVVN
jgi:GR25 family glycosyltransferase involved in LPS biosynthesis